MERPETVTERGETMCKRHVWVLESKLSSGSWVPVNCDNTRYSLRQSQKIEKAIGVKDKTRVVKYVPAVETKRGSKKAGVK